MEYYQILLPLALILIFSKFLSIAGQKMGLPQVVGMLLTGVLIGLIKYIPSQNVITADALSGLGFIGKIGVVLIMFSAGLETNVKIIRSTGAEATLITVLGVAFPMGLGFLLTHLFFPDASVYTKLFYGVIITATSVSVTVATLKELGKLDSPIGTAIVSAAILDDVIGIVLLSLVSGLANTGETPEDLLGKLFQPIFSGNLSVIAVLIKIVLFFAFIVGFGILFRKWFEYLDKKYPHHRRLALIGFGVCFLFAYASEFLFGIADITGAYFAGIMISGLNGAKYVDSKVSQSCYLLFAPVFFATIGLNMEFSTITTAMLAFGLCYIAVALLGKFVGCGLGAFIFKQGVRNSLRAGIGMMARAEVVLVCTQKGVDYGLINKDIYPFILILIIVTSFLVPILLKCTYKGEAEAPVLPPPEPQS